MLVHIQNLKKGDLLLFPSNGKFIMVIVLQYPRIDIDSKTGQPIILRNGTDSYKRLRVSCKREVKIVPCMWGNTKHERKEIKFFCTSENHNYKRYIYVNGREFWLLERGLSTI